jgi:hypothetical protein
LQACAVNAEARLVTNFSETIRPHVNSAEMAFSEDRTISAHVFAARVDKAFEVTQLLKFREKVPRDSEYLPLDDASR